MATLSVRVGGVEFSSPVLAAAGPLTETAEDMAGCAAAGAAGVVARTVSVQPARPMAEPGVKDSHGARGAMLNIETWSTCTIDDCVGVDYPSAVLSGVPLIISLGYSASHISRLAPLVRPFASAVELSAQFLADDPRLMAEAVSAAKAALDIPVWVKLTPLGRDVIAWADAAKQAGADAIVAIGPFGPCLAVDAERGQPLFLSTGGYCWMTGAAIKNIALRCVWDISRHVDIPVIGCGGVARGTDVVEFLMAGACAVQVCTAAVTQGPGVFGKITNELDVWLDEHGYASAAEVSSYTQRLMEGRRVRTNHAPPHLNVDLCIGCEICPTSCVYGALEMVGERKTAGYKVCLIEERCWGCGICATRCPTRALGIEGVSLVP